MEPSQRSLEFSLAYAVDLLARHSVRCIQTGLGTIMRSLQPSRPEPFQDRCRQLQDGFEHNIVIHVTALIERLMMIQTLALSQAERDRLLLSSMAVLRTAMAYHPPSRNLYARDRPMRMLLHLLHKPSELVVRATIETIICSTIDRPANMRTFEYVGGLRSLAKLDIKSDLPKSLVHALKAFVKHYTRPENEHAQTAISSSQAKRGIEMATGEEQRMPTMAAYDRWAAVYDSDGNILQVLDDAYIATHLPPLINTTSASPPTVVELGCGTGRNTIKLARLGARVVAVDNSAGMVARLRDKLAGDADASLAARVTVVMQDLSALPAGDLHSTLLQLPLQDNTVDGKDAEKGRVDGVLCTLVLEHLSLRTFFAAAASLLRNNGWLLLTSMHPDLGSRTSAGFRDPDTGAKVRPDSMNHSVEDILSAAAEVGFAVDGVVSEEGIRDSAHAAELGSRAEKWVGVTMHVGMLLRLHR
ncbi:hypothetical protein Dda_7752 [Drechslerella dactyloides]|uniref:Methyltransferase type 11 domain-containing protein n=1 Tax=Drechslerella dactyloides TaxID=74499 RepID=A0AAD6NH48_DREDA|nr:hypothetical protein Dda_7752 [Drechslerella dactyloides]